MIAGIFHEGSGLGDQLFRYITVRTLAEKKGYDWGMFNWQNLKGEDFLKLERGKPEYEIEHLNRTSEGGDWGIRSWKEKDVRNAQGDDIRSYDPEINFVEDNTIIDGSFEDDKYWRDNLPNISEWLAVEPLNVPNDVCVIGFRGGEYATQPDLFLDDGPQSYWRLSIAQILKENPQIKRFQVHTDDVVLAKKMSCFSTFEIVENTPVSHSKHTNMGFNWRSMRYAKYAIIPNSAFFILPRILRHNIDKPPRGGQGYVWPVTIAPRYWARHNTKTWARPACYYKEFTYI